ncbi:MFS transporter [Rhodococcus sp. WS1]|uniref:MFS transporter n=1 Tax=unclassified Rhodococcus (in: high G+C Gram-positive bacteria) TaxID=192944 RepID=UPI001142DB73|nr:MULTISPECIES: MFS transporter [unclassified Rhodococcus (in: high G+C Gram-positive bacteria)]ROZ53019.1 MFS transporter [Rhodococcus sp. WS1]TQC35974.1 MFS transporter [Rhodococcus sp. WS7]
MKLTARRSRLLPVLMYATLTSAIVSSLGMLLVPTISEEMDIPVSAGQWMLTINLLVGAVATPIMGRLSDGPHKKRLLLSSLVIVLVGSIIAAAAPNFTVFLVGRALQGLAYGIAPVTISLARRYLSESKVSAGISGLSVVVSTGLGLGYPLTGIMASLFGFRSAFAFSASFLVTAIAAVCLIVPTGPDETAVTSHFDFPGALLLGGGLATLLVAVSEGSNWGWGSPGTTSLFASSAILLSLWTAVEMRSAQPLVNLRVLRNGDVLLANATAIGLGATMYMTLSIISLIAQAPTPTGYGLQLPLFWAGFVMLPLSLGSLVANRLVRRVAVWIRMPNLLLLGILLVTASTFLLWIAHDQLWKIMIWMLSFGVGVGMTYAAMPVLIARVVAAQQIGSAVSFNQVLRTVGGSFGSALSGAILAAHIAPDLRPTGPAINLSLALGAIGCFLVFTAIAINQLKRLLADKPDHRRTAARPSSR